MSRFNPADSGYVEVKDRVVAFYAKHPDGSLQSEIVHLSDALVVVKSYAYRTADDSRPGVGHSQMAIPGPTSFTKGSEVENAETSAIGRAIASLGFEVHRSFASANEVANKQTESVSQPPKESAQHNSDPVATKEQRDELLALAEKSGVSKADLSLLRKSHTTKAKSSEFTVADIAAMTKAIAELGAVKAAAGEGAVVVA